MTTYELFTEWLDECPCPWLLLDDRNDTRTLRFFVEEPDDPDDHPSLSAAERNPSLR